MDDNSINSSVDKVDNQDAKEPSSPPGELTTSDTFQKYMYDLFEKNGVLNDLRSYLRGHIVNVLRSAHADKAPTCQKNFTQRLEYISQALNILIAEYLLCLEFRYSLSVFISEIPLANMMFSFAKTLMTNEDDNIKPRFNDNDVWCILNYLGIQCDSEQALSILNLYKSENSPLLLCIMKSSPLYRKPVEIKESQSTHASISTERSSESLEEKPSFRDKCRHYVFCKTCQSKMTKIRDKYKKKKKDLLQDLKGSNNSPSVNDLMKDIGVLERNLIDEMFEQLKSVYETEMRMMKEEEERKMKKSLATHSTLLQKKRDEMEESFKLRETELQDNVDQKKRFLWSLARALRAQHVHMTRAMHDVQHETQRLELKEDSLKAQLASAEDVLRTRGEEMRQQISSELAALDAQLQDMRRERDSISRERAQLELYKKNTDKVNENENTTYHDLRAELAIVKKYIESSKLGPICVSERSTNTDIGVTSSHVTAMLNNGRERDRLINDLSKSKNVNVIPQREQTDNHHQQTQSEITASAGQSRPIPPFGASPPTPPRGCTTDPPEGRSVPRARTAPVNLRPFDVRAERLDAGSMNNFSVGWRKGAGEQLCLIGARSSVLLPGDSIPFVGVVGTRTDNRRYLINQWRALRRRVSPKIDVSLGISKSRPNSALQRNIREKIGVVLRERLMQRNILRESKSRSITWTELLRSLDIELRRTDDEESPEQSVSRDPDINTNTHQTSDPSNQGANLRHADSTQIPVQDTHEPEPYKSRREPHQTTSRVYQSTAEQYPKQLKPNSKDYIPPKQNEVHLDTHRTREPQTGQRQDRSTKQPKSKKQYKNPSEQHRPSPSYQNLPEPYQNRSELRQTTPEYQNRPQRQQSSPKSYQNAPERYQVSPERYQNRPEPYQNQSEIRPTTSECQNRPERRQSSPIPYQYGPERYKDSPERYQNRSHMGQSTPEYQERPERQKTYQSRPERYQMSPERYRNRLEQYHNQSEILKTTSECQNLLERQPMPPKPYQNIPERYQPSPERYQNRPEPYQKFPEYQIQSEMHQATPEHLNLPDRQQTSPKPYQNVPERYQNSPERYRSRLESCQVRAVNYETRFDGYQKSRDPSPHSIADAKEKINSPAPPVPRDAGGVLRAARLRLRKLEIEADAVEQSYLTFRRRQDERRRSEAANEIRADSGEIRAKCGNSSTYRLDSTSHTRYDKCIQEYQNCFGHFTNKNTAASKISPIPKAFSQDSKKLENYVDQPLSAFRKYYQRTEERIGACPRQNSPDTEGNDSKSTRKEQVRLAKNDQQQLELLKQNIGKIYNVPVQDIIENLERNERDNLEEITITNLQKLGNSDENRNKSKTRNLLKIEVQNMNQINEVKVTESPSQDVMVIVESSVQNVDDGFTSEVEATTEMCIVVSPKRSERPSTIQSISPTKEPLPERIEPNNSKRDSRSPSPKSSRKDSISSKIRNISLSPKDLQNSSSTRRSERKSSNRSKMTTDDVVAIYHEDTDEDQSSGLSKPQASHDSENTISIEKNDLDYPKNDLDYPDDFSADVDNYNTKSDYDLPTPINKTTDDENFWDS